MAESKNNSGLLGLRVAVVQDEGSWFAQGLDVDYFAAGATLEEAERNFEEGLATTVKYHLQKFSNLDKLRPAPEEVVVEYQERRWPHVRPGKLDKVKNVAPNFAYSTVRYFES